MLVHVEWEPGVYPVQGGIVADAAQQDLSVINGTLRGNTCRGRPTAAVPRNCFLSHDT